MKHAITKCLLALIFIATLSGCIGTPVKISSEVDVAQFDMTQGRKVYGDAGGFQLLWFIPISLNGRHERAYRQLLENAGDSYVTDVTITEAWSYGFVGTVYRTSIEATAYPRKK